MDIDGLTELAQKIMQVANTETKYNAAANLQQKIVKDIGSVVSLCADLIRENATLRFGSYLNEIFTMYGQYNTARRCINLLKNNYNDVVEYESDTEEKRAERMSKLERHRQTINCIMPVKNVTYEKVRQGDCIFYRTIVERYEDPNKIYYQNGAYARYSELCNTFEYRLCRKIQGSSSDDLKTLFQKVCLYIALKNENTIMREELLLLGIDVLDDERKQLQKPNDGDVAAFTLPTELNTTGAKKLFQKAIKAGLMSETDSGYEWKKTKALCAYFADRASEYLKLQKGEKKVSWKPFETLFNIKGLGGARNDYQKTGNLPLDNNLVDSLFN